MHLLHTLHRAQQIGDRMFSEAMGHDNALTMRQAIVLAFLAKNPGASQTRLTSESDIDRSTMADIMKRLQTQGLVSRERDKEDARAYVVELTTLGKAALRRALRAMPKVEDRLLAQVPSLKAVTEAI